MSNLKDKRAKRRKRKQAKRITLTSLGLPFAGLATVATFEDEQKRP